MDQLPVFFNVRNRKIVITGGGTVAARRTEHSLRAGAKVIVFAAKLDDEFKPFLENPAFYAPQYDGHCAYGVSKGGKVPGNPNLWRIVDDKLYLNITDVVVGFWEEDVPANINLAEGNWPGIEGDAASTSVIPKFTSEGPVSN